MWQKFSFYDFRVIAHYLGVLMMFLAAAECVPFAVAVVLGEWRPASHYLFGMGIALIVGSLLRLILPSPGKLTPKQALHGLRWLFWGAYLYICRAIMAACSMQCSRE